MYINFSVCACARVARPIERMIVLRKLQSKPGQGLESLISPLLVNTLCIPQSPKDWYGQYVGFS